MLKKGIAQNFKIFFEIFTIFHDFAVNIMGIKKSIYGTYPAHHEWQDTLKIH